MATPINQTSQEQRTPISSSTTATLDAQEGQTEPTVQHPSWITNDQISFFESCSDFSPIANLSEGTVQIILKKPGLTAADFISELFPYRAHTNTLSVESSFQFTEGGREYMFTAAREKGQFMPLITAYTMIDAEDRFLFSWEQVANDQATTLANSESFLIGLRQFLSTTDVGQSEQDYLDEIISRLGAVQNVSGVHEYHKASGYYRYTQHVEFSSRILQGLIRTFGGSAIQEAALKAAYHMIGEHDLAGSRGEYGEPVTTSTGQSIRAGR